MTSHSARLIRPVLGAAGALILVRFDAAHAFQTRVQVEAFGTFSFGNTKKCYHEYWLGIYAGGGGRNEFYKCEIMILDGMIF